MFKAPLLLLPRLVAMAWLAERLEDVVREGLPTYLSMREHMVYVLGLAYHSSKQA